MENQSEIFPLVNEDGEVIGSATRGECHGGSRLLHPVVHLHVFRPAQGDASDGKNAQVEVYLQRRPDWKDIQPGKWDTAVGGHIDYGETPEEALCREAREELGITDLNPASVSGAANSPASFAGAANKPTSVSCAADKPASFAGAANKFEFIDKYVFESKRERELVYAYRIIYDGEIHPSAEELEGGRFWTMDEIREAIGKGVLTPNFESEFMRLFGSELV